MSNLTSVSLRLPSEIVERINNLAKATGRSRTFYMQEAIKKHLEELEDLYFAEQNLINIRSGKSSTVPLEVIMKSKKHSEK
ncbi:type II toxin-antitoxin system RelB family antitoxin [Thiopseudomonas alkaliphila]|uniref:type II toxin-antitoxin system RelB family antitoxin n=1 Tax=Thiopseudomonas alkaliphila TaxID=1697053 RepID=UPI0025772B21|nr:ribbon-helix-helix protein, CopG family [Thiopseudomonas alkaliphila]MDM1717323.1 ribbon-helix-helix protein, CopG family [Thiopseudomonas alkaliphila]